MGLIKRIRIKPRVRKSFDPSSDPSVLKAAGNALPPKIIAHSYNSNDYFTEEISSIESLNALLTKYPKYTHWIDVKGLGDVNLLEQIGQKFGIHELVIEDIVNSNQRPKLDEYDGYLFSVSRMLYTNPESLIENEQISFLLLPNVLLSFQENYHNCIDAVVERLKAGKGSLRTGGTSYMMYALMDMVIDNYFTLLNQLGDQLETLEELLYRRPNKSLMHDTQEIKRAMIMIRRASWPERDKLNDIIRSESLLITAETKTFVRDVYDHCMQVIDLVESYKEVTTSLIDMNLAFLSNKMNEIMKVLTVISSIFIPLTFIAGVYGMNFAYQDPETGKVLHKNMPELYAENGYVYTMIVMLIIALLQVIYFWRKGWLK
ncbi:MAG: magnesium and cobalt transport protein CorA [Sphingobacteriales bacterium]|nr:magnesium and cobalt transport protein CorA [Sphingobacteriales bacterium]